MDLQELEKYRAIPRGGLKLLAGVAVIALACVGVGFILEESTTVMWAWMLAGGSFTTMLVVVAFVLGLGDYLRRNVKGCSIAVYKDSAGECQVEGPHTREITRTGMKSWRQISLVIPLGGWFNRAYIMCGENYAGRAGVDAKKMVSRWRIKLVRIHAHTGAIIVRLIDRDGDRVTVSAKDALEILERFSARLEALDNKWDAIVRHGLIAECVLTNERDEAVRQRDHAFLAMLGANAAIKETSRFKKSKDAKRIRERLIRDILEIAPADHPLQSVLREEQGGSQSAAATEATPTAAEAREGG